MSLLSDHKVARHVVLFNVGSGQVRAAAATVSTDTPPLVHYTTASYVPFFDLHNKERYERAMLATLLDVGMRMSGEYLAQLSHGQRKKTEFICVLSSPWFVEATHSITIKKRSPFVVTRAFAAQLGQKARQEFVESLMRGRGRHADTAQIDNEVVAGQLNGYVTSKLYDRYAQEVRLTFHLSEATDTLQKRIRETLSQLSARTDIVFATTTFLAHSALAKIFPEEKNYVQVLVSGECTDISIIENGTLLTTRTFPYGTRSILRNMAEKHTMNFEEAASRAHLYFTDRQALRNDAVFASFQKGFDEWVSYFVKAAHAVSTGVPFPNRAVIIAEDLWQQAFSSKLQNMVLEDITLRDKPFQVRILDQEAYTKADYIRFAQNTLSTPHIVCDVVGLP